MIKPLCVAIIDLRNKKEITTYSSERELIIFFIG